MTSFMLCLLIVIMNYTQKENKPTLLEEWAYLWTMMDSNHRPNGYEPFALTS